MIYQRLRALRENINLLQKEVAEKLKINQVTYNRYEKGEREPDNDTLKRIADFFNVTTDYLLGREVISNIESINITSEDLELLNQIKKASPDKRKAIKLILDLEEKVMPEAK